MKWRRIPTRDEDDYPSWVREDGKYTIAKCQWLICHDDAGRYGGCTSYAWKYGYMVLDEDGTRVDVYDRLREAKDMYADA